MKNARRLSLRVEFLRQRKAIFKRHCNKEFDEKDKSIMRIIEQARRQLNYSEYSTSSDIWLSLCVLFGRKFIN